jgi:mono/diheme cytochrome c family protein
VDIEVLKESVWISIKTGRNGEGIMPSFAGELSDVELKGLAFYVHSLGGGQ